MYINVYIHICMYIPAYTIITTESSVCVCMCVRKQCVCVYVCQKAEISLAPL